MKDKDCEVVKHYNGACHHPNFLVSQKNVSQQKEANKVTQGSIWLLFS
jgi:hypothetical protein